MHLWTLWSMMVASEQYTSARQGEYKCKTTFQKDGHNDNHLRTFYTQRHTDFFY
jgi:hypothetical protein